MNEKTIPTACPPAKAATLGPHATHSATLAAIIRAGAAQFAALGLDSPELCARLLAGHALGLDRTACITEGARLLSTGETQAVAHLMNRRASSEPLAYILGHKEFYGRDFMVTPHTLIPRPDTELLIDAVLAHIPAQNTNALPLFFADIGTGSGCIGITLSLERPALRGLLLDNNKATLKAAAHNAHALGAATRLCLVQGDMYAPPLPAHALDIVVSNPPYIAEAEYAETADDVLRFEPHEALFSTHNGLAHLEAVIAAAKQALKIHGRIFLEHGYKQGKDVRERLADANFDSISTLCDTGGHERCTVARRAFYEKKDTV